jgi:hypothetical protein
MSGFLSRFSYGELMGFLTVGGGLVVGAIAIIGGLWTEYRKNELMAGMKQSMLERGMSAEEIGTVMNAGTKFAAKESKSRIPVA